MPQCKQKEFENTCCPIYIKNIISDKQRNILILKKQLKGVKIGCILSKRQWAFSQLTTANKRNWKRSLKVWEKRDRARTINQWKASSRIIKQWNNIWIHRMFQKQKTNNAAIGNKSTDFFWKTVDQISRLVFCQVYCWKSWWIAVLKWKSLRNLTLNTI